MRAEVGQGLAVLVGDHRVTPPSDAVIVGVFNVADGRSGAGDEVRRRCGVDDRLLLLGGGEVVEQEESRVLLLA
ncbi:MAG: hypothetical protein JF888_06305 [Candidatus Dormibacteraeota bacterium]|uniref:Uncharacterized protein n=1 Tax=Candidatus Dormiibacter inghamiae TaxID=3127013 RepID=A0A934KIN3_9BACT|nr:hypothetical protein [Candidatus Dormibacteraeota bacterium]MBJ7605217.1 hypothetical protein [Candidatus Dormibacteraeota bacterium]